MLQLAQSGERSIMPLVDNFGQPWAHSTTIKAGDRVKADGGFTCIKLGEVLTVERDDSRDGLSALYIPCEDGRHYLDGQLGDDGELVGLYPA